MKTIKIIISGTVQGVFFRRFVKDSADKLKVRGFVRNLDNGDLEIIAEGENKNVDEFLNKCKKGPPHSDVKNLTITKMNHQGFDSFKILTF